MANFEYLIFNKDYQMFAQSCIEAEKVYFSSPGMCAIGCRKALEMAVKWTYAVDDTMTMPYQDNLQALIHNPDFYNAVDRKTWSLLPYIIKLGNLAVHSDQVITNGEALTSLHNLFDFIQWIDYCYAPSYEHRSFDDTQIPSAPVVVDTKKIKQQQSLLDENQKEIERLKAELEAKSQELAKERAQNQANRVEPDVSEDISEYETRKKYIDLDLKYLGWLFDNTQIQEEYEVENMAGVAGQLGYVDYVLFGRDGKPLALIEAKRTSKDPKIGKNQAQYYADALERKFGRRPMIFLSNGFTTYFWDNYEGPERKVGGFFSRDDLQRLMNRRGTKGNLEQTPIQDKITNRYYQKAAIRAVCEHVDQKFRKNLLVMATGTGKTRTAASLVDVFANANYVTNVLFLADRRALVKQAKEAFKDYLPTYSLCNLLDEKDDANARIVFSTYPTILNAIDFKKTQDGMPLYTPAHFDMIIIDESHRSIFKKYRAIFDYFDAILVGLTATPKTDVDKNTYEFFECEGGVPTYAYDYDTAVYTDHVLVPYYNIEVKTQTIQNGIHYDDLSDEDKQRFEEDFTEDDGSMETDIEANRIDRNVYNKATVDYVLQDVMQHGIKLAGGDKLAKTIIFAQNKRHAEFIIERFNKLYPMYGGTFCKRVLCEDTYAQSVIDDFKRPAPPIEWSAEAEVDPQIIVSVDMMDTGIDVPQIGNLVFFKQVFSKTKFWQMIGRGTRRCDSMQCVDGQSGEYEGKKYFYIFDYCGNFEFFRENPNGIPGTDVESLDEVLFSKRIRIASKLQDSAFVAEDFQTFRTSLTVECCNQVAALNEELAVVRMYRELVNKYKVLEEYEDITDIKQKELIKDIAPIVSSGDSDEAAKCYDNTIFTMILSCLDGSRAMQRAQRRLLAYSMALQKKMTVPQVAAKKDLIDKTADPDYWKTRNIVSFEDTRSELRELIKFLDREQKKITYTNITETIIDRKEGDVLPPADDYEDYYAKVNRYINDNRNMLVIAKLTHNKPLSEEEYGQLEKILTVELGSKEDYEKTFEHTPFGIMVRKIAGMDHEAVMEAFSEFISSENLNTQQINFVNKIIGYIETNGYIEPEKLMQAPFDKPASIIRLFDDKKLRHLMSTLKLIKDNAENFIA